MCDTRRRPGGLAPCGRLLTLSPRHRPLPAPPFARSPGLPPRTSRGSLCHPGRGGGRVRFSSTRPTILPRRRPLRKSAPLVLSFSGLSASPFPMRGLPCGGQVRGGRYADCCVNRGNHRDQGGFRGVRGKAARLFRKAVSYQPSAFCFCWMLTAENRSRVLRRGAAARRGWRVRAEASRRVLCGGCLRDSGSVGGRDLARRDENMNG